jgi:hypothetical protein
VKDRKEKGGYFLTSAKMNWFPEEQEVLREEIAVDLQQGANSPPLPKEAHKKVFSMLITKVPILFPCRRKHTHKSVQHADNQGGAESKALCSIIVQKHVAMAELHQHKKPYQK